MPQMARINIHTYIYVGQGVQLQPYVRRFLLNLINNGISFDTPLIPYNSVDTTAVRAGRTGPILRVLAVVL